MSVGRSVRFGYCDMMLVSAASVKQRGSSRGDVGVLVPSICRKNQDDATIYHIPIRPCHFIDHLAIPTIDCPISWLDTKTLQSGSVPKLGTFESCKGKDNA